MLVTGHNRVSCAVTSSPRSATFAVRHRCNTFCNNSSRLAKLKWVQRPRYQPVSAVADDEDEEPTLPDKPIVTDISDVGAASAAPEPTPISPPSPTLPKIDESESPDSKISDVKAQLLDSLFGTERGLSAGMEVRAEINELVTQLESLNPTPSPNEAADMLDGEWKLVYTSNSELIGLLALNKLPLVTVGDITQTIDATTNSVNNKVQMSVPFARTAFSTTASFNIRSPKLLNIKFQKGTISTPQLLEGVELPPSVTVMGQTVDLKPVEDALSGVRGPLQEAVSNVAKLVSQQPDLSFPIASGVSKTWLLNTYLDEDTRITRGDGGSVFILVKEVSMLAAPPASTQEEVVVMM